MSTLSRRAAWAARLRWVLLAACLCVNACRTPPPPAAPPPPPPAPEVVPERIAHYRIDDQASQVLILVYRDGPMARLGHNHVLTVHQLAGEVVLPSDPAHASFGLEFPVAAMTVDDPQRRAEAGQDFKDPIDAASIEGTRGHLLGAQQLDAAHFPSIRLQSEELQPEEDHWRVTLLITVRHHDTTLEVPVAMTATPDQLTASGEFDLTHTQLGLTPYSVGLGALRVAETLHVRFRLLARRTDGSEGGGVNP
jgi:YceI-like domain